MNDEDLLARKETAALLRISTRTLDRLETLPRIKLTARRILFRRSDIRNWVNSRATAA